MKKIILICLLMPALLSLKSCELLENPAPRDKPIPPEKPAEITYSTYSFIADSKKEAIFTEYFSNNSRSWPTTFPGTLSYLSVSDGKLNMMSNFSGETLATIDLNGFNGNNNFEIDVRLLVEPNVYDNGNKIIWGYQASGKQHNFLKINNQNTQFSVGRFDGSKDVERMAVQWSGMYARHEYNKYTIRKVNNQYYYFINENLLYQEPFTDFKGYRIGFQTSQYSEIYVDHLTIKKLNL